MAHRDKVSASRISGAQIHGYRRVQNYGYGVSCANIQNEANGRVVGIPNRIRIQPKEEFQYYPELMCIMCIVGLNSRDGP